jgi:DNA-directed RNA polymerase subunit H (RpoH/RPB5)
MGRIRATASHKKKKNRPITKIGSKQYKKKRWLADHKTEVAGHDNVFTQEVMNSDPTLKKVTALQHYTRVGLTLDPSATVSERKMRKESLKKAKIKKGALPDIEAEAKPIARMITETEGTMLCNLMHKHGTNFKAMSLDYKLNPFQLTPKQLQRKLANYLKFERAAFPEQYEEMQELGLIEKEDEATKDRRRRQRPEAVDGEDDKEQN